MINVSSAIVSFDAVCNGNELCYCKKDILHLNRDHKKAMKQERSSAPAATLADI